jgi:fructokinase
VRIGIDLGGTKIEAIALADSGATLIRRRVPTPAGDYGGTLSVIGELVDNIERELSKHGSVGVASPGAISPRTGLMKNANSTVLNGRPLDTDLSRILRREVRLENDANCFALSEASDGAAQNDRVVFGVILGTGVGGGIVINRTLTRGRNRIAGEWGHNPLPWPQAQELPGPECYCGKRGCIETFLSGPGLSREYEKLSRRAIPAKDIAFTAAAGDASALECLSQYQDRLARSLASLINILDPDAVVLGGGLSNLDTLYLGLIEKIQRYVFSDSLSTIVYRAAHGDSSGVRGAAWLWPKSQDNST